MAGRLVVVPKSSRKVLYIFIYIYLDILQNNQRATPYGAQTRKRNFAFIIECLVFTALAAWMG
jgi:hypothetical protein